MKESSILSTFRVNGQDAALFVLNLIESNPSVDYEQEYMIDIVRDKFKSSQRAGSMAVVQGVASPGGEVPVAARS
jgi:hypothetical protein